MRRARGLGACLGVVAALISARAGAASPKLAPVRAVDMPVVTRASQDQDKPGIAFGGGQYLAVWRDGTGSSHAVVAARISTNGTVLDDPAITIASQGVDFDVPAVAYDGKRFLVVWVYPGVTLNGQDIAGVYVDSAGQVSPRFDVIARLGTQNRVSVGGGDGFALVTWGDDRGAVVQVRGTLYDDTGAVVSADRAISPPTDDAITASLAWSGSAGQRFLAVWSMGSGAYPEVDGATLDTAGSVGAPFRINAVTGSLYATAEPTAIGDGNRFIVSWADQRDDVTESYYSVYGAYVSATGTPSADFRIARQAGVISFRRPQVTYVPTSSRALVVWESVDPTAAIGGLSRLFAGRISSFGVILDGDGSSVSSAPPGEPDLLTNIGRHVLATDGQKSYTVWTRRGGGVVGNDVYALPTDPAPATLAVESSLLVSRARNAQITRSAATNGTSFLVVWEDQRGSDATGLDVYGLRVGLDGTPMDAAPFVICDAVGDQFDVAVAGLAGGDYLVAWADGRSVTGTGTAPLDIFAARVGQTGPPRESNGFLVRPGPATKARLATTVAAKDDGWLVAWEDWRHPRGNNAAPELFGAVVSAGGSIGAERQFTTQSGIISTACAPSAAWNGKRFFIAYEQPCSLFDGSKADLLGQWLAADGTPIAAGPVILGNVSESETAPRVATLAQGRVAVSWRTEFAAGAVIRGAIIDDGASSPQKTVMLSAGMGGVPYGPSLSGAGTTLLLGWVEAAGVYAQRFDDALAAVGEPSAFAFLTSPALVVSNPSGGADSTLIGFGTANVRRWTPPVALASTTSGATLAGFDIVEQLGGKPTPRVQFTRLGIAPPGATCDDGTGCADAFCTAGQCCDEPCTGVCQKCGKKGCVDFPFSDARCAPVPGIVSCGALTTSCRTYVDRPLDRCQAFGVCASYNGLGGCDTFSDLADGTPCSGQAGASLVAGTCKSGSCDFAFSLPVLTRRAEVAGCALTGSGEPTRASWWLLAAICLAVLARRQRARLPTR